MPWETEVETVAHECINCGIMFYLSKAYDQRRRQDHATFYCPNGHGQIYADKSEAEKLRDRLAVQTALYDQERARCADLSAQQKAAERKMKRMQSTLATKDKAARKTGKLPQG